MKLITLLLAVAAAVAVGAAIHFTREAGRLASAETAPAPGVDGATAGAATGTSAGESTAARAGATGTSPLTADGTKPPGDAKAVQDSVSAADDAGEIAALRAQQAELPKLRGELARLRAEAQRAKAMAQAARPATAPTTQQPSVEAPVAATPPGVLQVTGRVASGETMIMGGWVTPDGRRMMAFATPTSLKDGNRVTVRTQVILAPDELWSQFGVSTAENQAGQPVTISQASIDALLRQKGAEVLAAPAVITQDGEEARVQVGRMNKPGAGAGEQDQFMGIDLQLKTQPTEDRKAMDMQMHLVVSTNGPAATPPAQ
jgi:hypothetical protein